MISLDDSFKLIRSLYQTLGLKMTLADRTYYCEACGLELDRDRNAALNILRLGMSLAASKDASEASAFRPR